MVYDFAGVVLEAGDEAAKGTETVARGFIPAGLRSSPKMSSSYLPDTPQCQALGLLRSPTGINPLATRFCAQQWDRRVP
jgi:hypothetical protein